MATIEQVIEDLIKTVATKEDLVRLEERIDNRITESESKMVNLMLNLDNKFTTLFKASEERVGALETRVDSIEASITSLRESLIRTLDHIQTILGVMSRLDERLASIEQRII